MKKTMELRTFEKAILAQLLSELPPDASKVKLCCVSAEFAGLMDRVLTAYAPNSADHFASDEAPGNE